MFKSLKNLLLIIDKKNFSRFYFLLFIILTLSIFEVISIGLVLPVVTFLVNENSINIFRNYINIDLFNNISNDEILHLSILLLLVVFFLIKFIFQIYFYTKQNQIVFDIMHVLSRKLFNNYLSKPFYFF